MCPEHPDSKVVAAGVRETASGVTRRYRCTPMVGAPHRFTVRMGPGRQPTPWSPPPACPRHPGAKVVRAGTYGKTTEKPRQRYRCSPVDGKPHTFTPALPRDHVHEGEEHCDHCEELRGIHRGETAVARRHTWSTRVVVRGLQLLAQGGSYAEVGRWAKRVTGVERRRAAPVQGEADAEVGAEAPRRKRSAAAVEARRSWHIAADWIEAFVPAIYEPVDERLRTAALEERARLDEMWANGEVLDRPQVILLDDVPVYGRDLDDHSTARRDAGFFVLALAETHWSGQEPTARLRLVRAMAKSNAPAWLLVFDELGYDPDFVIADAGTGIVSAIEKRFDPQRTKFIPSLWHLRQRIEKALTDVKGAHTTTASGKALIAPLRDHMRLLGRSGPALASQEAWTQWWDDLEALMKFHKLPLDKMRTQRRNNEQRLAAVLDDIVRYPNLPVATGGLETLIAKNIQPQLSMRRTAFANLERTNLLFDLVVADHHGAFDNSADVVRLLREDTAPHGGWTVPLRSIADPRPRNGAYSSLRDTTLLNDLAAERGLL